MLTMGCGISIFPCAASDHMQIRQQPMQTTASQQTTVGHLSSPFLDWIGMIRSTTPKTNPTERSFYIANRLTILRLEQKWCDFHNSKNNKSIHISDSRCNIHKFKSVCTSGIQCVTSFVNMTQKLVGEFQPTHGTAKNLSIFNFGHSCSCKRVPIGT